jgi:2-keto-3-deoxy-L-rhamnonate aldolase RhmA
VRYGGGRGVSGLARSTGYGIAASGSWREDSDRSVACIVQIERVGALEQAGEIAALEDVDALLVGPADLANDLGCEPTLTTPMLRDAALAVVAAAAEHGKTAGIHLAGADPSPWARSGASLLSTSFESALLLAASRRAHEALTAAFL